MKAKDEATTYHLELIMLGAVQQTKEASHAIDASELIVYWVEEVVVLWVQIRVETSHAGIASELVVCSPVIVASSTIVVKNRIFPEGQAGQHVILSERVLRQVLVGYDGEVKRDAVGLLVVLVHTEQQANRDVAAGALGGQEGDHGLSRGHHHADVQVASGRAFGEHGHGQSHQCGGRQGGLDVGKRVENLVISTRDLQLFSPPPM